MQSLLSLLQPASTRVEVTTQTWRRSGNNAPHIEYHARQTHHIVAVLWKSRSIWARHRELGDRLVRPFAPLSWRVFIEFATTMSAVSTLPLTLKGNREGMLFPEAPFHCCVTARSHVKMSPFALFTKCHRSVTILMCGSGGVRSEERR